MSFLLSKAETTERNDKEHTAYFLRVDDALFTNAHGAIDDLIAVLSVSDFRLKHVDAY